MSKIKQIKPSTIKRALRLHEEWVEYKESSAPERPKGREIILTNKIIRKIIILVMLILKMQISKTLNFLVLILKTLYFQVLNLATPSLQESHCSILLQQEFKDSKLFLVN